MDEYVTKTRQEFLHQVAIATGGTFDEINGVYSVEAPQSWDYMSAGVMLYILMVYQPSALRLVEQTTNTLREARNVAAKNGRHDIERLIITELIARELVGGNQC